MYPSLKEIVNYSDCLDQIKKYVPEKHIVRNRNKSSSRTEYKIQWNIKNDIPSIMVRAIQEKEIMKTRIQTRMPAGLLPSFAEIWDTSREIRTEILNSAAPHEEIWKLQKKYGYKMATTFMPQYAKAIYSYFGLGNDTTSANSFWVLDPCAGWGDRLFAAAAACPFIDKYVAFDPNYHLRDGYKEIMETCGIRLADASDRSLIFSNGFEVHSLAFEKGIRVFPKNTFHLAFTSPPFYDYEVYTEDNPVYKDWETEFYQPLFSEVARVLVPGGHFCLHMGETTAGSLTAFLEKWVETNLPFKLIYKFGLVGLYSSKTRDVWVYQCVKSLSQNITTSL